MDRTGIDKRYLDANLPVSQRVDILVSQMTLREKIAQTLHAAPPIPRLDVPAYNWWNECLHGVGRAGRATVFPQAIGLAATFDVPLVGKIAVAVSDEARAKHHQSLRRGGAIEQYFGLTYWTPNINIFRDPRWGRGQETYGEDPYLTARMGVAFVKGLQGSDPKYLKLVATPKHYAVHSGPEPERHSFDAVVNQRDLRETYLPAFKACVQEGKAYSVMGAYNRMNGEPCCGSPTLLEKILRQEWGFEGFVVSDCGAIHDFHANHKITKTPEESVAMAVKNGCDLNCGDTYERLLDAVGQGLLKEEELDVSVKRLFTARFKLGMFDAEDQVPFSRIPASVVRCWKHITLARRAARESIVLLKNENNLLPLKKDIKSIAVIGPNALAMDVLWGNYNGFAPEMATILEGIIGAVSESTQVSYARSCEAGGKRPFNMGEVEWTASGADVIIAVMGYTPGLEGEEGATLYEEEAGGGGDRVRIGLPGQQLEVLKKLQSLKKPVVLVLTGGSPIELEWAAANIPAIVMSWYPGEQGGHAVADVLFGDHNPAGRLPLTFVKSLDQVPPFNDYNMKGRTYRFMTEQPLYPFGYGLSYTTFAYSNICLDKANVSRRSSVRVSVDVENTGTRDGDEVVQLYVSDVKSLVPVPVRHLEGVQRIHLKANEKKTLKFLLKSPQLAAFDDSGRPFVEPGEFAISVGGGQPGQACGGAVTAMLTVK